MIRLSRYHNARSGGVSRPKEHRNPENELLAEVALAGGITKAFVPKEKLSRTPGGAWTEDAGAGFVKTLGVLEILAAVGLILPALVAGRFVPLVVRG